VDVQTRTRPADRAATLRARHEGEVLARVRIDTEAELSRLRQVGADQWTHGDQTGWHEFRLTPDQLTLVREMGLEHEILRDDVADLLAAEAERLAVAAAEAAVAGADFFADYRPLEMVEAFVDGLVADHADLATKSVIGTSIEGRPIHALTITGGDAGERPAVVINALQHAREWITVPTVLWFADTMLDGYATDAEIASILDAIDLHIVYMTNPDGYVYSHDFERLWRKNRRDNGDGTFGVDLNRNWSFQWGGGGSSGDPESLVYRGVAPFSEPETTVLSDFILSLPDAAAHLDVHSYGQLILSPFGYDFVEPAGIEGHVHETLGRTFSDFIEEVGGSIYDARPAWSLYLADGTCSDWAHGAAGAISFTFELRPDSASGGGFVLPPEQIVPTAIENRAAFLDLCRAVARGARIGFPSGLPDFLDATAPAPIDVLALPIASAELDPATARAFVDVPGEPLRVIALTPGGTEGSFSLTLDPLPCGETVGLAFEIESVDGRIFREPTSDTEFIEIPSFVATDIFADDSETDPGWAVQNIAITGGAWERGVPAGDGDREDPTSDADGSGAAWLTENLAGNSDVDGGPTRLLSPSIDLSGTADPLLRVSRWMRNDDGDNDRLRTLLSDDDGLTWVEVDAVNNLDDWETLVVRVADHIVPSSTVRVRFDVADTPNNSVTEAGIDAVAFYTLGCPAGSADVNGDGTVDFNDLVQVLGAWGPCTECPEDVDGDGIVGLGDLLEVLAAFG
jgi:carboxypeptidase A2